MGWAAPPPRAAGPGAGRFQVRPPSGDRKTATAPPRARQERYTSRPLPKLTQGSTRHCGKGIRAQAWPPSSERKPATVVSSTPPPRLLPRPASGQVTAAPKSSSGSAGSAARNGSTCGVRGRSPVAQTGAPATIRGGAAPGAQVPADKASSAHAARDRIGTDDRLCGTTERTTIRARIIVNGTGRQVEAAPGGSLPGGLGDH